MRTQKFVFAGALALLLVGTSPVFAQGNGRGRGRGHNKDNGDAVQSDNGDHGHGDVRYYYRDDRDEIHDWYLDHQRNLPPGLAKKDRLPPGLEKQLVDAAPPVSPAKILAADQGGRNALNLWASMDCVLACMTVKLCRLIKSEGEMGTQFKMPQDRRRLPSNRNGQFLIDTSAD